MGKSRGKFDAMDYNSIYLFISSLITNKSHPKNYRLYTLIFQNIIILGFLIFTLLNSNPFSLVSPIPKEGLGLNPILQDPALAIHCHCSTLAL